NSGSPFADGGGDGGPPPKFPAGRTPYPQRALLITTNNNAPHRIWHRPGRSLGNRPRRAGDAISGLQRPPAGYPDTCLDDAEPYKIRVTKSIKIDAPDGARSWCGQSDCRSGNPLADSYA